MALPNDCEASKPDDFAFFRPTQSEFVLQQFGPIVVFANGAIVEEWPVLPVGVRVKIGPFADREFTEPFVTRVSRAHDMAHIEHGAR